LEGLLEDQVRELVALGKEQFLRGDYSQAAVNLETVVARGPQYPDVHHMLGCIYHEQGEFEAAERAFTRALELNPGYVEAALNLAIVCNDLGQYERAQEVYAKALAHAEPVNGHLPGSIAATALDAYSKGKLANLHAAVGDGYLSVKRPAEAAEEYQRALSLCPGFVDLRLKLAHALRDAGRSAEALAEYRAAALSAPGWLPARVALGTALHASGKVDEARAEWEEVLRQDPAHRTASMYLKLAKAAPPGGGAEARKSR
jgi:tetratricopeptide (TPR) repeat protein